MLALDRTLLVPGFQGIMVCLDMIGLGLASNAHYLPHQRYWRWLYSLMQSALLFIVVAREYLGR